MAIINNVAYSWSMITLSSTALGIDEGSTTLEGVSAIKWSKKRKVESNYGMGEDWTTTTVTLKGCIFTEDCLESQQDDTNITHEFDLNPFDIQIGSGDTI